MHRPQGDVPRLDRYAEPCQRLRNNVVFVVLTRAVTWTTGFDYIAA